MDVIQDLHEKELAE